MKNKIVYCIIALVVILNIFEASIFAVNNSVIDTTKKGTLTITKYEHINGDTSKNVGLSNVEFTIYRVSSDIKTIQEAQNYIRSATVLTKATKTTNNSGIVKFESLDLGRYYVEETKNPENVLEPVNPFLVDIPMTNSSGDKWEYDVKVYPKNVTVYGKVELETVNSENQKLSGVYFKLQQKNDNIWSDYKNTTNLVTDTYGKIILENLPAGEYRLVVTQTPEGYIKDISNTQDFTIDLGHTDINLNMLVEKPEINLELLLRDGTYGKYIGAYIEDTTSWKITSKVPTIIEKMGTYEITDNFSNGLTYIENTMQINGIDNNGNKIRLEEGLDFSLDIEDSILKIKFINTNLKNYNNVEINYDTKFNENVIYGQKGNQNNVNLNYTNVINIEKEEETKNTTNSDLLEVHTGRILIFKTDGENNLQGAVFRIATSKDNAKKGIYLTNSKGEYIEAVSDDKGQVIFEGLSYGQDNVPALEGETKYWIVEVQAPTYEEEGQTKYYNLLKEPVEVIVNTSSDVLSSDTVQVINKKPVNLPITGGVGITLIISLGIMMTLSILLILKRRNKFEK